MSNSPDDKDNPFAHITGGATAGASGSLTCPRCGNPCETLSPLDPGTRLALEATGQLADWPEQVCSSCLSSTGASVSQGMKLRNERDNREKEKAMAWKNRVHLIKNARNLMNQKAYSEVAVQYEKYLRVLEMVYNVPKGELSPKVFNNSTRSKEMTVIASVYWDLLRIYDTSPRYGERMQKCSDKLGEFLQFSPIYPDIVRRADQFLKSAKNPQIVKNFLRAVRGNRGPCFVATAAFYDQPQSYELFVLRKFRDQYLRTSWSGRQLIWAYYKLSPPLARWVISHPRHARAVRALITEISVFLRKFLKSP